MASVVLPSEDGSPPSWVRGAPSFERDEDASGSGRSLTAVEQAAVPIQITQKTTLLEIMHRVDARRMPGGTIAR
jgi:hypothetical protein